MRSWIAVWLSLLLAHPAVHSVAHADDDVPRATVPPDRRHVDLDGQSNFRDLGGYRTDDGRIVRFGQVYRSGILSKLSDSDAEQLRRIGVRTVVNFLTDKEISMRGADRLPDGVAQVSAPISVGDNLAMVAQQAIQSGDFSKVPAELNQQVHAVLVEDATEQYRSLLLRIAKSDERPLVFHCSHGVHRTGTAAALLLWTLGVPWEAVREDYLLSNHYRKAEIDRRLGELRKLAAEHQSVDPQQVDMTNMRAFYVLQPEYIDAARDHILQEYGSLEKYLDSRLGLSAEDIGRLRTALLQPAAD